MLTQRVTSAVHRYYPTAALVQQLITPIACFYMYSFRPPAARPALARRSPFFAHGRSFSSFGRVFLSAWPFNHGDATSVAYH